MHSTLPVDAASRALDFFRRYGDRTNSLVTLNPDFSDFTVDGLGGVVRHLETPRVVAAASEPLMAPEDRAEGLVRLARSAQSRGKRTLVMPVGRELAEQLRERGFSVWQGGAEPIYDLRRGGYLPDGRFPLARALKRRGGEVVEIVLRRPGSGTSQTDETSAILREMAALRDAWLSSRPGPPLGFLSRSLPFHLAGEKRYFLLRVRGELQGFLCAAPFCRDGEVLGWYFQDIVRSPNARAGASELLVLETMRLLAAEGAREVRLGMAPLAGMDGQGPGDRLLRLLFERWRWGYGFKSLYEFKAKLRPTSWQPLYVATWPGPGRAGAGPVGLIRLASLIGDLRLVLDAHLPGGLVRAVARQAGCAPGSSAQLTEKAARRLGLNCAGAAVTDAPLAPEGPLAPDGPVDVPPLGLRQTLLRAKYSLSLTVLFFVLHILRLHDPSVAALFERSAYVPGRVTWEGILLGPLFHNHWFHLFGDLTLFALFGALIEILLGPAVFWALTGIGLWLSNPMTHAIWALGLERFDPSAWATFLAERDYGSSNATFTLVGGFAALLRRNAWLLGPFFIYGLFICFARNSWLALHHILAMVAGVLLVMALLRPRAKR